MIIEGGSLRAAGRSPKSTRPEKRRSKFMGYVSASDAKTAIEGAIKHQSPKHGE